MLFGKDLYAQVPLKEVSPPALPSLSPQVWQAAFVHSSKNIGQIPRSKFRYAEDFADNERLEWVGDALLYSIVANYLFRTYPKLRVSYLSAIRQRMVQNATLAKFAKLYKMDQALVMGSGAENMRYDQKTLADTFEAFVGAVHQVHGLELTTQWIEDLIRPYATQLYDHYAQIYGEDAQAEEAAPSEASSAAPPTKSRWRRFCGFIPIPFLYTHETKPIASSSSGNGRQYGTLIPVSQAASNQGYTRLAEENTSARPSAMKKGTKPQDTVLSQNTAALASSASATVKRSKSRDRVAFTPPSVTNLESLKSAQKKARQAGAAGSLSEGEAPRTVPGLPKPAPATPKQSRTKTNGDASVDPQIRPKQEETRNQSETIVYPIASQQTPARPPPATMSSAPVVWNATSVVHPNTASGAPAWDSDSERVAASSSKPEASKSKATPQSGRTILQRPTGTPAGQVPNGTGVSKTFSQAQSETGRSSAVTKYVEALTAARTDPVAFLESHTLFDSKKNKKAKSLQYDDTTSTPKKCVVQIKVDGKMVAQSAAAGQDVKLAKARAAFKAIDALSLLPEAPEELADRDGFTRPEFIEEPVAQTETPVAAPVIEQKTAPKPRELAIPANSVWLPDIFRRMEQAPTPPAPQEAPPMPVSDVKLDSRNPTAASSATSVQLKKQADAIANPPGPLPGSIYASLPGPGVKGSGTRYYITSVKGFNGGNYHAILNAQLELIGQAASSKKSTAIEEAEKMAQANAASGKKLDRTVWQFLDCSKTGTLAKKVKLMDNPKSNTGDLPLLTHALAVDANEKARLIWLEWYADDRKAWKCVVFADAVYVGSGKGTERKQAITAASANALQKLEEMQVAN